MGFLEVFLTPLPNDQRGIFVFIPSGQWPELFVTVFYFLFFIKVFYIRWKTRCCLEQNTSPHNGDTSRSSVQRRPGTLRLAVSLLLGASLSMRD